AVPGRPHSLSRFPATGRPASTPRSAAVPRGWSYIVFVVKPTAVESGRLAVLASTNTWNAYNNWGWRSKYTTPPGATLSFERPDHVFLPESGPSSAGAGNTRRRLSQR